MIINYIHKTDNVGNNIHDDGAHSFLDMLDINYALTNTDLFDKNSCANNLMTEVTNKLKHNQGKMHMVIV